MPKRPDKPIRREVAEVRLAGRFADMLPFGGDVLEIAPVDGSLVIQLARTGGLRVACMNVKNGSVEAARRSAEKQGVRIDFQHGSLSRMPFDDCSFDFVVCRNTFHSLPDRAGVLREMRRVLKPGRRGVIIDLRRDVPMSEIRKHVKSQHKAGLAGAATLLRLRFVETRRALSRTQFEELLAHVPFGTTRIEVTPVGLEVWFER